jgi:hypothetical protein
MIVHPESQSPTKVLQNVEGKVTTVDYRFIQSIIRVIISSRGFYDGTRKRGIAEFIFLTFCVGTTVYITLITDPPSSNKPT